MAADATVRAPDGKWTQITRFEDQVVQAVFGTHDDLYLISRAGAPRGKNGIVDPFERSGRR